jgi:hypothetical protein
LKEEKRRGEEKLCRDMYAWSLDEAMGASAGSRAEGVNTRSPDK